MATRKKTSYAVVLAGLLVYLLSLYQIYNAFTLKSNDDDTYIKTNKKCPEETRTNERKWSRLGNPQDDCDINANTNTYRDTNDNPTTRIKRQSRSQSYRQEGNEARNKSVVAWDFDYDSQNDMENDNPKDKFVNGYNYYYNNKINGDKSKKSVKHHILIKKQQAKIQALNSTVIFHECTYADQSIRIPQYPTFVIAGAQKSGTTSLLAYFAKHPLIARPAYRELHFFDIKIANSLQMFRMLYSRSASSPEEKFCYVRQQYASLLSNPPVTDEDIRNKVEDIHPFAFEKSPSYLHHFPTPKILKQSCPWIPKVIIVLRNPVDRAYSQYKMKNMFPSANRTVKNNFSFEQWIEKEIQAMRGWGMTTAPPFIAADDDGTNKVVDQQRIEIPHFHHPVDEMYWNIEKKKAFNSLDEDNGLNQAIRKGIYAPQVKNWLDLYPKDSIMIIDYHQLHENTSDVYFRILDFAGIPRDAPQQNLLQKKALQLDYDPMSNRTREYLEAFFAPYNAQLADILGEEWRDIWTSG